MRAHPTPHTSPCSHPLQCELTRLPKARGKHFLIGSHIPWLAFEILDVRVYQCSQIKVIMKNKSKKPNLLDMSLGLTAAHCLPGEGRQSLERAARPSPADLARFPILLGVGTLSMGQRISKGQILVMAVL